MATRTALDTIYTIKEADGACLSPHKTNRSVRTSATSIETFTESELFVSNRGQRETEVDDLEEPLFEVFWSTSVSYPAFEVTIPRRDGTVDFDETSSLGTAISEQNDSEEDDGSVFDNIQQSSSSPPELCFDSDVENNTSSSEEFQKLGSVFPQCGCAPAVRTVHR